MLSLRNAFHTATVGAFAAAVVIGEASGQTDTSLDSKSPAEWAKAIAMTMAATTPQTLGGPISLKVTSRGTAVEMQYEVRDAAVFERIKAGIQGMKLESVANFCKNARLPYLKKGVTFHQVFAGPGGGGKPTEFTVDAATCASLQPVSLADARTLAQMAQDIANKENVTPAQPSTAQFKFDAATAHEGVVEERFTVAGPSEAAYLKDKRQQFAAYIAGRYCYDYGSYIRQGLSIRHVFALADGSPVIDFIVDRSYC